MIENHKTSKYPNTFKALVNYLCERGELDKKIWKSYQSDYYGIVVTMNIPTIFLSYQLFLSKDIIINILLALIIMFFTISSYIILKNLKKIVLLYNSGIITNAEITACNNVGLGIISNKVKYNFIVNGITYNQSSHWQEIHLRNLKDSFPQGFPEKGDNIVIMYYKESPEKNNIFHKRLHDRWCFNKNKLNM